MSGFNMPPSVSVNEIADNQRPRPKKRSKVKQPELYEERFNEIHRELSEQRKRYREINEQLADMYKRERELFLELAQIGKARAAAKTTK